MKTNRIFVMLVIAGCLVAGLFAYEYRRESQRLTQAAFDTRSGRYEAARSMLGTIILPGVRTQAAVVEAAIRKFAADDLVSEKAVSNIAAGLHSTGTPLPPAAVEKFAQAVADFVSRPVVDQTAAAAVQQSLGAHLPAGVSVRVEDLRSPLHAARIISLSVAEARLPHRLRFARVFVRIPMQDGQGSAQPTAPQANTTPAPTVAFLEPCIFALNSDDLTRYSAAVALDWAHGIAVSFAGPQYFADGTRSNEQFWHILRIDDAGNAMFDNSLAPFTTGIVTLAGTRARGIIGRENGAQRTDFDECRTCPHVLQEYTAEWNAPAGKYILSLSRIKASPYAAVASYVHTSDPDQIAALVDASGKARRLTVFRQAALDAEASGQRCRAKAEIPLGDAITEVRFVCPNDGEVAVSTVKRLDDFYLVNAYVPHT